MGFFLFLLPSNGVHGETPGSHRSLQAQNQSCAHLKLQEFAPQSWTPGFKKRIPRFRSLCILGIQKLSRNFPPVFWDLLCYKPQELTTQFTLSLPGALTSSHRGDKNASCAQLMLSKKHCWWAAEMRQQHRGKGSGHQGKAGPGAVPWTHTAEESQDTARDGQGSGHKPKRRQEKSNYKSTKMGPTLLMNICILAIVRPGTGRIALIICVCRNPSKLIPALWETMASQAPANDSPKRNSASQGSTYAEHVLTPNSSGEDHMQ